jgi:hypothetical protein
LSSEDAIEDNDESDIESEFFLLSSLSKEKNKNENNNNVILSNDESIINSHDQSVLASLTFRGNKSVRVLLNKIIDDGIWKWFFCIFQIISIVIYIFSDFRFSRLKGEAGLFTYLFYNYFVKNYV